jgi:hypothetical protein
MAKRKSTARKAVRTIDVDAEERARALTWLPHCVRMYEATKNPVYAWEAFRDAHVAGLPLPSSIARYFLRCATRIALLVR